MATNWFERKRDKALFARVTYTAYVDGQPKEKQLIKRIDSLDDLPKALYELKEKAKKLKEGSAPIEVNDRMSVNAYLDKWLADIESTVCERTYEDYECILERYIRPAIGKKQLTKVHYTDIKAIVAVMQKRGLSPRTIRYAHRVISMALKRATEPPWNLLPDNPARHVTKSLPKEEEKTRVWLSGEAVERFIKALDGDRLGLMFELALITGLRPEEYFALQWQRDVDLERGTVTVNEVLYRRRKVVPGKSSWYFKEPKTPKSRRTIPLPEYLVASLKRHKAKQGKQRSKAGAKWQDHDLVFCTGNGTPHALWNVRRSHFLPILERAGLTGMRMYDLRHSCASLLVLARENLSIIQKRLGHENIRTTEKYIHVNDDMQRGATDKLVAMLPRKTR